MKCQYCGNDLMVVDGSFWSVKSFQVVCTKCLSKGPNATSYQGAIDANNTIVKPKQKYREYEFCKDVECPYYVYVELEKKLCCAITIGHRCFYSVLEFQEWLKQNKYKIVKA